MSKIQDIRFEIKGLREKTDLVNEAIFRFQQADRLLAQANSICLEAYAASSGQIQEEA